MSGLLVRIVSVVELILKHLNKVGAVDLTLLLRAAVVLHAQHNRLLGCRERVMPRYVKSLKDLRQTSLRVITQMFDKFGDAHAFTEDEVEAVCHAAVWPRLNLSNQGLRSTTGLTALFRAWIAQPRSVWCRNFTFFD